MIRTRRARGLLGCFAMVGPTSLKRGLLGAALVISLVGCAWLALTIHPQPLFAFSLHRAGVVLHARTPLPPEAGPMLDEAMRRVSRSPLYDRRQTYDVFLTGSSSMYAFLTCGARGGGMTSVFGNVFIRPANVATGRVFDRDGRAKTGERTLAYFVAHEVTHAVVQSRIGLYRHWQLAAFQREGYADYVGFAHTVDFAAGRAAMRRNAPEMDTSRSGLYARYELYVAYLLDRRGMSVDALLARPLVARDVDRTLNADDSL